MANKIKFELINTTNAEGRYFIAMAFRGGNCTRNYFTSDDPATVKEGNYSFFNLFFRYLEETEQVKNAKLYVLETASVISISVSQDKLIKKLRKTMDAIFRFEPDPDIFVQIKKKAMDSFQKIYPKIDTQLRMKSFEFAHFNKGFRFRTLIEDLMHFEYEDFCRLYRQLIIPSNIHLVIYGNLMEVENSEINDLCTIITDNNHEMEYAMLDYDPYLRHDAHSVSDALDKGGFTTLTFDFLTNTDFTLRFFLLSLIAESLPFERSMVHVDAADSNISFENKSMKKTKHMVQRVLSEPIYLEVSNRIMRRYLHWFEKYPREFTIEQASRQIDGINIFSMLSFIEQSGYQDYLETLEGVDFIVKEGQTILRKFKGRTMKDFREDLEKKEKLKKEAEARAKESEAGSLEETTREVGSSGQQNSKGVKA